MKIKASVSDPENRRCVIELADVQDDVVCVCAKGGSDVLVLFETSNGGAPPHVVSKLREMADDLERGLKADMTPPTTQPKARA
jgi:hypothetical protein